MRRDNHRWIEVPSRNLTPIVESHAMTLRANRLSLQRVSLSPVCRNGRTHRLEYGSAVEPMYAVARRELPEGPDWLYEIKLDGYRCIAAHDSSGVKLWSRRGNLLTSQFPDIARACQALPQGTVVDGEIVALNEDGLTSFNLLQHHRSRASAIRYYFFDLLFDRGKSWLDVPLEDRRAAKVIVAGAGRPSASCGVYRPAHRQERARPGSQRSAQRARALLHPPWRIEGFRNSLRPTMGQLGADLEGQQQVLRVYFSGIYFSIRAFLQRRNGHLISQYSKTKGGKPET